MNDPRLFYSQRSSCDPETRFPPQESLSCCSVLTRMADEPISAQTSLRYHLRRVARTEINPLPNIRRVKKKMGKQIEREGIWKCTTARRKRSLKSKRQEDCLPTNLPKDAKILRNASSRAAGFFKEDEIRLVHTEHCSLFTRLKPQSLSNPQFYTKP